MGFLMKARDVSPLRVLVVDDYPDTRRSLRLLLASWGHEAREATDGTDALQVAEGFRPHPVLLDLAVPVELAGDVPQRQHASAVAAVLDVELAAGLPVAEILQILLTHKDHRG